MALFYQIRKTHQFETQEFDMAHHPGRPAADGRDPEHGRAVRPDPGPS